VTYLLAGACIVLIILLVRANRRAKAAAPTMSVTISRESTESASSSTTPVGRATDSWEGSFWEVQEPRVVRARLHLKYVNADGEHSTRLFDVKKFGVFGPTTLLIGYCHLRNATRTFRVDRIQECSDAHTGEVLEDVAAYLWKLFRASPENSIEQLDDRGYDVLRVLLFVGKADGQLRAPEREQIRVACTKLTGDSRITSALIDDLLSEMDVPSLQAFKLAVGRLADRDSGRLALVLEASEAIVSTQKTVHPAEAEALRYLRDRVSPNVVQANVT